MSEVVLDQYPVVYYHYKGTPHRQPSKRELRLALLEKHKNCYWCGIEVTDNVPGKGQKQPHDLGTIDHLICLAERGKGVAVPKVLACYKCNISRSVGQNPNHHTFRL